LIKKSNAMFIHSSKFSARFFCLKNALEEKTVTGNQSFIIP
jgi:hypothetical protein